VWSTSIGLGGARSMLLWLESTAMVDMLACYSWTCGMVSKVGCSTPSVMVGRA
jgi:hypothetical protein